MQKVNIIIGRFQPFTYGHLKCIQNIYQEKHLKTVMLMIDTINPSIKNPYKSSLLLPIYNEALRDYKEIEGIILIKNANIITISEELNKYGYQISSWVCGTDRYKSYKRMSENYGKQANLSEDFTITEIQRTSDDISATEARRMIKEGDIQGFSKITPLKIYYNILRQNLLNENL